ncbi:hypothetical protein [Methylobacterium sp. 17Sr1-1]|uniref:hypothetical protein n=1 Tax=Methylobacterium sp. 17Sr1-1 TaxID=2202826 RepID=UPI000D6FF025|nr:hypothetical protein [Methylobacterium sp. 17Sr1-1]AWN51595.1 hypothetical protein DK412_07735 [Methylobacterium sp. 17Sr1-1]
MTEITVPCATCSGTGWATHEDRHTETNRDQCRTCGGTGQVPARPGESRETSWPFAVRGAEPAADLWCCHVIGPDDVYAAPDLMTAVRWSRIMNAIAIRAEERIAKRLGRPLTDDDWVLCFANVERWPWSAEAHARAMPEAIKQMSPRGGSQPRPEAATYQGRSAAWMSVAFADDPTDGPERRDRAAEEVCEGYQTDGGTLEDWIAIGRYTFGRPAGALPKEIGQILFTVACWAAYRGIDMMAEAERELARCSTPEFIEKLARKRATRHGRGPLPGFSGPETSAPGIDNSSGGVRP